MSHWWRAYDEAIDDPKLLLLPSDKHRWNWFCLMGVASAYGGVLPPIDVVAVKLRMSKHKAAEIITVLVSAKLIDRREDGQFEPHNWNGRQYRSDVTDATAAERMKRYRKKRNAVTAETVTPTVTVTPPRVQTTETETEAETKKEDAPGGAPPTKYAFESGVIRLVCRDLDRWKAAFSHLDVPAELEGLSPWAADQPNWFHAVKGALAKRNREVGFRLEAQRNGAAPVRTPSGNLWPEGIT